MVGKWVVSQKVLLAIAVSSVIATTVSSTLLFTNYKEVSGLRKGYKTERLKEDSILSTKILLDKEIFNLKASVDSLNYTNTFNTTQLRILNTQIAEKEELINKLKNTGSGTFALKSELADLKAMRAALVMRIDELVGENKSLRDEIEALKKEISAKENTKPEVKPFVYAGNFKIEALKNGKVLTVKSKKASALRISFDVAGLNGLSGNQNIYISVTDPAGVEVLPAGQTVTIHGKKLHYSESLVLQANGAEKLNTVNLKVPGKLRVPGEYNVKIYHPQFGQIGAAAINLN